MVDNIEQTETTAIFAEMLAGCSRDGGKKLAAGKKVPWQVDRTHKAAVWSHFKRRDQGELVDPDSGEHPFTHAAWRLLAIAYQETHGTLEPEGTSPSQAAERLIDTIYSDGITEYGPP